MHRLKPAPNGLSYGASLQHFCEAVLAADKSVEPYSHNYLGGHARALENTYPAVCGLLGSTPFAALARVYLLHHPPAQWDLNFYGDRFAELIQAQTQGGRAADFPWQRLADIARIEYAITQAYYADDWVSQDSVIFYIASSPGAEEFVVGTALQHHYPFADIDERLCLSRATAVRREALRVKVENNSRANAPAGAN